MAIVWILLWTWAFIMIIKYYKTESTIWMSVVAFFTGLGAFSVVFEETIMKYFIVQYGVSQRTIDFMNFIDAVIMANVITAVKGQVTVYSETEDSYFSIQELQEKVTLLMAFEIKKGKCEFAKEINTDPEQKIKGDVNSLIQVLNNLITNAIEASKEENTITFGAYKMDGCVVFFVRNLGQKIPEEIQGKIFNKMVTTKGKNGTGLGLYISKSIIKVRFNGEIYFETNDNETTFFVKIPLTQEA